MDFEGGRFPDWEKLYQQAEVNTLPWFYEPLDPDLEAALLQYDLTQGRFLDLGTGPGTQAIALSQKGFQVTGSDLSVAAIEKARTLSGVVDFVMDNILSTRLKPGFKGIFDRGCFHVLAPEARAKYVETVFKLLAPEGYLFLKPFSTKQMEWDAGPYRFSPEDIHAIFEPPFRVLSIKETVYQGTLTEMPKALFAVLQKSG